MWWVGESVPGGINVSMSVSVIEPDSCEVLTEVLLKM